MWIRFSGFVMKIIAKPEFGSRDLARAALEARMVIPEFVLSL